jgi:DNA modification methylase
MPKIAIEWNEKTVKVSDLKPYERNPRTMTKEAFTKLKASLRDNGYHQRIIAQPDGAGIGGHQRIRALNELGITEIKVLVPNRQLSFEEFRRILVQDNLPFGEFDFDILSADFEVDELKDWGMPAFMIDEMGESGGAAETEEDEAPEPPADPVSRLGDIWLLGDHRLLCGNAASPDGVKSLFEDEKADITITDPPYGIGFRYDQHDDADNKKNAALVEEVFALGPRAKVWTCGLANLSRDIARFGEAKVLVWYKKFSMSGNGLGGASTWEPILVVDASTKRLKNDVLEIMTDREKLNGKSLGKMHTCPKPVALWAALMEVFAKKGDIIYDPFMGSGTSIIAAEQLRFRCYGMEISPAYVDVAIMRWEAFTGRKATLKATGETFAARQKFHVEQSPKSTEQSTEDNA